MRFVSDILRRCGLAAPDGRALHAYLVTPEEQALLGRLLETRIGVAGFSEPAAQGFVLWAAEHIRTRYAGGQLTWEFVFAGLRLPYQRDIALKLTEAGLTFWQRRLRSGDAGREFLFSLLAEGGLPDLALAEAPGYRGVLLDVLREVEAEGVLGATMANAAALRGVGRLPQVMRNAEQARLLADLACALAALRAALPEGLPPGGAETWLDANRPGWRQAMPLRLSPQALDKLVRPALAAERPHPAAHATAVQRQLRRVGPGVGWVGVAMVAETAFLLQDMLPKSASGRTLRLLAADGAGFLALPDEAGWRMTRSYGRGDLALALAPDAAVVMSVHADGQAVSEVVLDPGFPSPLDATSLWRPASATAAEPDVLVPLSGRGQTRAAQVYALGPAGVVPVPEPEIELGLPEPGPGGILWPLSGNGRVHFGDQVLRVATGADAESPAARLLMLGPRLTGFELAGGQSVHLGQPIILGAEDEAPLTMLGARLRWHDVPGLLGGQIAEWVEDGVVLARARVVVLASTVRLDLRETEAGCLRLATSGLTAGWHIHLTAGQARGSGRVMADGTAALDLVADAPPGMVDLRLSDPSRGASLHLLALWPSRAACLLDPKANRLTVNQQISRTEIVGWRGMLPQSGGAVQLRLGNGGAPVAFAAGGVITLSAFGAVIDQALTLLGADGRVNLRLVGAGQETARLEIGRYDWASEPAGQMQHLGHGITRLQAVCLNDAARTAQTQAEGRIDPAGWLGEGDGLWFIQGHNTARGVMRPFVWTAARVPRTTREVRLTGYADGWRRLLEAPDDPGWDAAWELIAAVRAGGDAAALDQVQALARVPAAAAALVLRVSRNDRAAALALETEAPLWWPLVGCDDWAKAVAVAKAQLAIRLAATGMPAPETTPLLENAMARLAGEVVQQRPELGAHLGQALAAQGLLPLALTGAGPVPLAVPGPKARLRELAQQTARRHEVVPSGAGHLRASGLKVDFGVRATLDPLLHAPLVAAEVAAGKRPKPEVPEVLQLIALRAADPQWFDAALPAALTLAMETPA